MVFYHNNRKPKTDTFQINSVSTTNPKTSKNENFSVNKSSWYTEKNKIHTKKMKCFQLFAYIKMNLNYKPKQEII